MVSVPAAFSWPKNVTGNGPAKLSEVIPALAAKIVADPQLEPLHWVPEVVAMASARPARTVSPELPERISSVEAPQPTCAVKADDVPSCEKSKRISTRSPLESVPDGMLHVPSTA